jgi:hypothetical protein
MEMTLPPIPTAPGAQAAMLSAVLTLALGVVLMVMARQIGAWWGLAARAGRDGAIGELRPIGGFLGGLGLAGFLFDQPVIYVMIGAAWALAAFGRLLSMMSTSDRSNGLLNFLFLLLQVALAAAALYWLFDVWTGDVGFQMPEDQAGQIVFAAAVATVALGFVCMFAPGMMMLTAGLSIGEGRSRVIASARALGGMLIGAAGVAILANNPMCELALGSAFAVSVFGRILALIFETGRYVFQGAALVLSIVGAAIFLGHVFGYF